MPNNSTPSPAPSLTVFIKGQLWKVGERCIRIEHVGKLLVEHRGVTPTGGTAAPHRSTTVKRMASIKELEAFLKANHGVLMTN